RDMAVDGHLGLEQLLAGGVDVGGVGESDVAAQLLLDGNAGGGVAEGAEVVGIDLDAAGAEEFLHAAADGGIERAAKEGVGGVGGRLLLLLGVQALLVGGVAERQQRQDIGFGQRRVAAIGNGKPLRRAVEAESDVVILNAGGGA